MSREAGKNLCIGSDKVLSSISPNVNRPAGKRSVGKPKVQGDQISAARVAKESQAENTPLSCNSSEQSDCTEPAIVVQMNNSYNPCVTSQKVSSLFIGDLDPNVTEKMLNDTFRVFPSLISVKICVDSETGISLGYGYLNFYSSKDAETAIERFSYVNLFGREVRIMPSMRNSYFRKNIGTNVFFSNLPLEQPALTTRVFYETFREYGKVLSCKLDRRKNIGFVYFESDAAARKAIASYNNKEYYGNIVTCGLHFDKDIRRSPEFEKRRSRLGSLTVAKENLLSENNVELGNHDQNSKDPHPNSIHVKNLPFNICNEDLLNYFSRIGPVKSVFTSKLEAYRSSWGFVTYKKGSDTRKALESLNGAIFMDRRLEVNKALKNNGDRRDGTVSKNRRAYNDQNFRSSDENSISSLLSNGYRQTLFLSDLSLVCNDKFLGELCRAEKINYHKIVVDHYDEECLTYSGYIVCKSRPDANRLFEVLNNKLIGDSIVRVSWRLTTTPYNKPVLHNEQTSSQSLSSSRVADKRDPGLSRIPHASSRHPNSNINDARTIKRADPIAKIHLIEALKNEVRDSIDFIKCPDASRDVNLKCISEYIFDVYWRSDVESLTRFLLLLTTKQIHGRILEKQVQEAIRFLGFQR